MDIEILEKCKQLEKKQLTKEERTLVKLIKAQLEDDWRASLIKMIKKLLQKLSTKKYSLDKCGDTMTTQQIGVKAIIEYNNKILLIKRSAAYGEISNSWDIPGGRTEFGEDPEDGLKREIKEEIGLELKEIKHILDASTVFKNEEKQIVRITYLCTVKEKNIQLSHEHTDMQWVSKDKLKTIEFKDKILKKIIEKYVIQ